MSEQAAPEWGSWKLVAAASGSLALGLLLGYRWGQSSAAAATKKRRGPKLVYGARLGPANGVGGGGSADSTPAATPRALSREDSAHGPGLRMVLLVRTDPALVSADWAGHAQPRRLPVLQSLPSVARQQHNTQLA